MENEMSNEHSAVCPHCGHCQECGRGGHQLAPYPWTYPVYPWQQQTWPWWGPYTIRWDATDAIHGNTVRVADGLSWTATSVTLPASSFSYTAD